jgi:sulfate adenylyltransferase subunit 1
LNEVGMVTLSFNGPVALDPYTLVHGTGSFVVIDRMSNVTVGAGMVRNLVDGSVISKAIADMSHEERMTAFGKEVEALVRKYFG